MTAREREDAIEKFVEKEIFARQTGLVEEAFKKQLFSFDDIENIYRPFDGKLIDPAVCVRCNDSVSCLDSETGECESCFEDSQQPQEVFEWWLVSPWLGKQFLLRGEPILDNNFGLWWGRCTGGQAISMDYIIQQIYDDLMT